MWSKAPTQFACKPFTCHSSGISADLCGDILLSDFGFTHFHDRREVGRFSGIPAGPHCPVVDSPAVDRDPPDGEVVSSNNHTRISLSALAVTNSPKRSEAAATTTDTSCAEAAEGSDPVDCEAADVPGAACCDDAPEAGARIPTGRRLRGARGRACVVADEEADRVACGESQNSAEREDERLLRTAVRDAFSVGHRSRRTRRGRSPGRSSKTSSARRCSR
jgi:hypothetical protein